MGSCAALTAACAVPYARAAQAARKAEAETKSSGRSPGRGGAKKKTVAKSFGESLTALAKRLKSTNNRYIRCLKPNQTLKAGEWNPDFMTRQLEYSGLIEVAKVRKAGFPHHREMLGFLGYYCHLCVRGAHACKEKSVPAPQRATSLLAELKIDPKSCACVASNRLPLALRWSARGR